jgi:hypothetical protein
VGTLFRASADAPFGVAIRRSFHIVSFYPPS